MTCYIQESSFKIISRIFSKKFEGQSEWDDVFKVLKEKYLPKQEYYIEQNCPSEVKVKLRLTQTSKN